MKFGVDRQALLYTAGIVWIVAGVNILRIGLVTWHSDSHDWLFRISEAIAVFLLFFNFVFKKLYYKHTQRIEGKKDRSCPFSFFDTKGWIVMIVMIATGIIVRKFALLPTSFISVFYTGLSTALVITGFLFLRYGWIRRRRQADTA